MEIDIKGSTYKEMQTRISSFDAAFKNARLESGKLGFFDTVEEEAYREGVKSLPVYSKYKNELDAFAEDGNWAIGVSGRKNDRKLYEIAVEENRFALDENENIVNGENHNMILDMFYDKTKMKGYLLAKKYGFDPKVKYKEIVEREQKLITESNKDVAGAIFGDLAGYALQPETLQEMATSPAYIGGKTIFGGALSSFGIETTAILSGEIVREQERRNHLDMLDKHKELDESAYTILENSAIGGAIRGLGSFIVDSRLLRRLKAEGLGKEDFDILKEFVNIQQEKLSKHNHGFMMDKTARDMEQGKPADIIDGLDIDINEKVDPNIEPISLNDEIANMPEMQSDKKVIQDFEVRIDEDIKTDFIDELTPEDEDLINTYLDDPRLYEDEEVIKMINNLTEGGL